MQSGAVMELLDRPKRFISRLAKNNLAHVGLGRMYVIGVNGYLHHIH